MKMYKNWKKLLTLLSILGFLTSCSPPRPDFQSDEQMKLNFKTHKNDLLKILDLCSQQKGRGSILHSYEKFSNCEIDPKQLKQVKIKEIDKRYSLDVSSEFKGIPFLFITDRYLDDSANTYFEEKGYIFSKEPLNTQHIIKDGSLAQFEGEKLIIKNTQSEGWRFKEIEPGWYIYYRQYLQMFMH
jgi:hypothetical protein